MFCLKTMHLEEKASYNYKTSVNRNTCPTNTLIKKLKGI